MNLIFSFIIKWISFIKQFFSPSQIFDASTNKWKLIDEKQHTDVVEKIIEMTAEEDLMYRKHITDDTKIITNRERNLTQEDLNERYVKTVDNVDFVMNEHIYDENIVRERIDVVQKDDLVKKVRISAIFNFFIDLI